MTLQHLDPGKYHLQTVVAITEEHDRDVDQEREGSMHKLRKSKLQLGGLLVLQACNTKTGRHFAERLAPGSRPWPGQPSVSRPRCNNWQASNMKNHVCPTRR